jgi:hypothetical protein
MGKQRLPSFLPFSPSERVAQDSQDQDYLQHSQYLAQRNVSVQDPFFPIKAHLLTTLILSSIQPHPSSFALHFRSFLVSSLVIRNGLVTYFIYHSETTAATAGYKARTCHLRPR